MNRAALPLDIKLMTALTRVMGVGLGAVLLAAAGHWALNHRVWTVQAISVHGDVTHQSAVGFRAQLATQRKQNLSGSFLTLDLRAVQSLFESMPWVRKAVVQREFPNRLRVTLEEHEAMAWWGSTGSGQLVNRYGEVFDASPDDGDGLPELAGPATQSAEVWTVFQQLGAEFNRLDRALVRLELTGRGNWRAELDNGTHIELGRGDANALLERTQRFTSTLSQVTDRYTAAVQSVDLRYPNGYALRMHGVTTLAADAPDTTKHLR